MRHRRLRVNQSVRDLVRESHLSVNDFIVPLFVTEGSNIKEEISSMPNYFRLSLDNLEKEVKELWDLGLKSVLLFVKVPDNLKDYAGTEALNPDGLIRRAIKAVKIAVQEMVVMSDVALVPSSSIRDEGIVEIGDIIDDITVLVLAQMSLAHAHAG